MPNATIKKQDGASAGSVVLSDKLFGAKVTPGLMHQAVLNEATNSRQDTRNTKTRGEVAGGGRKPYRPKRHRPRSSGYDQRPALPPWRYRLRSASPRPFGQAAEKGPARGRGVRSDRESGGGRRDRSGSADI